MRIYVPMLMVALLAGCQGRRAPTPPAEAPASEREAIEASVVSALDPSVDPCVDFYAYACGGWMQATPLPDDRPILTRGFTTIADANEALLRQMLEDLGANPPDDPVRGRIGRFYAACMDTDAIDARGLEPVQPLLERLATVDHASLFETLGWLQRRHGSTPLFSAWAGPDEQNPDLNILQVGQPRLGLPDRSYYLGDAQAELRGKYVAHLQRLLVLGGATEAEAGEQAAAVLALETALAEISWERTRLRDSQATYNKIDRAGLVGLAPDLSWDAWFVALGAPELQQVNVSTPSYFEGLPAVLADLDVEVLRAWLRVKTLADAAPHLSSDFVEADFDFNGRALSGQQAQRPRWKQCVGRTDTYLGDLVGQVYVDLAFAGESKEVALDMIRRIEGAFEAALPELAWMDDTTREKAADKARSLANKIGYPDRWKDYAGVEIGDDYWENLDQASMYWLSEQLGRLEQPVDRSEWFMTPPTVNAYYHPIYNEIAFPAGILQPPFYGVEQPMAMNFGAIGMVVGHEITHGFDDQGRQYDRHGRLIPWWEPSVSEAFDERAQCVDDLYSGFEALPGQHVNGKLTLGENIADLGGLKQSWQAWQDWAAERGDEGRTGGFAGLEDDQLFFVAYAQAWCTIASPETVEVRLRTDSHAPPRFRVNGAVMNLPAFGDTFQCEVGAPMRPAETCEVW